MGADGGSAWTTLSASVARLFVSLCVGKAIGCRLLPEAYCTHVSTKL